MSREDMQVSGDSFTDDLNLHDFWLLIKERQWQIYKLVAAVMLLATLVVFQMTPVYRSTALLLIENAKSKVLTINDLYEGQRDSMEAFNSQVQILKSRPVAEKVIRKLKLFEHPEMVPPNKSSWFGAEAATGTREQAAAKLQEAVIRKFESSLTIEPIIKSQMVRVSFDSTDKEFAAKVANAVVEAYIDNELDARSEMTQKANAWLLQRMEGLRKKLEESEQALQHFREQENIIDNRGVVLSGSGKQFEEVSTNLVAARWRLAEAQSAYNQVRGHKEQAIEVFESIPAVLKDPTVQQMKHAETEATRKVIEYKGRYGYAHPKMIAAETDQKSMREALARAVEAAINGIYREYELARANAEAAAVAQAQIKADIQTISRKEFKLGVLRREVESNKQLYDTFVGRAKETEVSTNMQSTTGRLIDPAVVSSTPLKPKKLTTIAIAGILALLVGIALVILLDYLDSGMRSVPDVERRLGVDVLGTIQTLEKSEEEPFKPARAFLENPNSLFSESVRTIRTAVLLSAIDEPHRVVAVTSTLPGEGKTTVAINLAFALGQMKKVLIVDGDIRRPSVGNAIGEGIGEGAGLIDFLAGEAPINECIRKTSSPNVFVLPAGKSFNSPLELVSSQKFCDTVSKMKEMFDVVLIDCPPLKPVSDALVISQYTNAVIYVVEADATPHQLASEAIKRLHGIKAPLLGVVLNLVDYKKADRYGHYAYQYAYGQEPGKPPRTFLGIKI